MKNKNKMDRLQDILPSLDLGDEFNTEGPQKEETTIKIKPIYEIAGNGCACLGFMQYRLAGFDSASYMEMLSNPETMQTIKEIYYKQPDISDELVVIDSPEIPLEY